MKKVLIDSSSVVLLFKAGLLDRLIRLYHVIMARVVYGELTINPYPGSEAIQKYVHKGELEIMEADPNSHDQLSKDPILLRLDPGEKETIQLYIQGTGDFIIIDDGKGAGFCRDNKIPYINALLFPRILYCCGMLSELEYKEHFDRIIQYGRYSDWIIDYALNVSGQDIIHFVPKHPGLRS